MLDEAKSSRRRELQRRAYAAGGGITEAEHAELRELDDGDVWMLGGGKLQMAFIERGALDEIEVYVTSVLVGGGYPLFPPTGHKATLKLLSAKALGVGMARLHYSFG